MCWQNTVTAAVGALLGMVVVVEISRRPTHERQIQLMTKDKSQARKRTTKSWLMLRNKLTTCCLVSVATEEDQERKNKGIRDPVSLGQFG